MTIRTIDMIGLAGAVILTGVGWLSVVTPIYGELDEGERLHESLATLETSAQRFLQDDTSTSRSKGAKRSSPVSLLPPSDPSPSRHLYHSFLITSHIHLTAPHPHHPP